MRQIYFAKPVEIDGFIKIGCSTAPSIRTAQIGFDLALEIEVIATVPGGFWDERSVHHKFEHLRAQPSFLRRKKNIPGKTEWFRQCSEIASFVSAAIATGKLPLSGDEFREAAMFRLRRQGESYAAIAAKFGVSKQRVHQIVREIESGRADSIAIEVAA